MIDRLIAGVVMTIVPLTATAHAQSSPVPDYDPAVVQQTAAAALESGDTERGIIAFGSQKVACISCHRIGKHGGTVGPDLSKIGKDRTPEEITESILWPARQVEKEFVTTVLLTSDGLQVKGYPVDADPGHIAVRDPATGRIAQVANEDIEEQLPGGTLMPDALATAMTARQLQDVVRFLCSLGKGDSPDPRLVDSVLSHSLSHAPAEFAFDRRPLRPDVYPHWQHHVNRDRLYDFYAKQAEHFRTSEFRPPMIAAYPGLDGGYLGHWGNQIGTGWQNDDWAKADHGRVLGGVLRGPGIEIARAICVRLGDEADVSACFNLDTLTWDAVWTGGFVEISSARHGFVDGLKIRGTLEKRPVQKPPTEPFEYQGMYRHGDRVIFAYRIGDTDYLDAPWAEDGKFTHAVAPSARHPLKYLTEPGPPQWPQRITTKTTTVKGAPFAIDSFELPNNNPWKLPVYPGGHAFLKDGSALLCTVQGDVWHVSGLVGDRSLRQTTWRRFASGLHHALGIVIDDDGIFVQCRDQLVCLHDLNQDGEADFHECFSMAFETSAGGHDFICGLERDAEGRFYTVTGNQGLVRISADGKTAEILAVGVRNPDGLGLHPDGTVTLPCSEGEWTPATQICAVRPDRALQTTAGDGKIGQHHPPHFGYPGIPGNGVPDLPLLYIPRGLDHSAGAQCAIRSDQWGPLNGRMIHTSHGTGNYFLLLRDEVDGQLQGGLVPLPGEFLSGAHRARFNPVDGHLYIDGMSGWGSYTPQNGCFHRVRCTGGEFRVPITFHAHENGILVEFSEPLDSTVAEDINRHFAQCWNYIYSGAYGSLEYSPGHRGTVGHDVLAIESAHVLEDRRQLFLEIPELQPVNQLHLRLNAYVDGGSDLFLTIHRLDVPFEDFEGYRPIEKTVSEHPILADMRLMKDRVPNPFQKQIASARSITIEAATNLSFVNRQVAVRSGEPIRLTMKNPDVVPHNWALLKRGTLQSVGQATNRMVADPSGYARHYIPRTDDVLVYTDIVTPKSQFTVFFHAPKEPGHYPFLCTFPGHWMVMNGEMIVE